MLRNLAIIFLLAASFLLSSCGSEGEDTAIVTYIVAVNQGSIARVTYFDSNGQEFSPEIDPSRRTFVVTLPVKVGSFLFLSAQASLSGTLINISGRIISNGAIVSEAGQTGEDGNPGGPIVEVEGFATNSGNGEN